MRKNFFSARLRSLPIEKKVIGISSVIAFLSCFLPWYGISSRGVNEWWNAFSSIGSVAGYAITLFMVLSLGIILLPVFIQDFEFDKRFSIKENVILLFSQAQSLFVTLLFIPVYAQYSLINATSSGTRFGIYVTLLATLVSSLAALSSYRKKETSLIDSDEFVHIPRTHRPVQNSIEDASFEEQESSPDEESLEKEQESIFGASSKVSYQSRNSNFSQEEISSFDDKKV